MFGKRTYFEPNGSKQVVCPLLAHACDGLACITSRLATVSPGQASSCVGVELKTRSTVVTVHQHGLPDGAVSRVPGEPGCHFSWGRVNGVAEIVSVVSAKAELDGNGVAIGVVLDEPLALLRASMATGAGSFQDGVPGSVRVIGGGERAETGAKFVRP